MKSHHIKIEKSSPFTILRFKYCFGDMLLHFDNMNELKQFSKELEDSIREYIKED